jgi:hypothetical protein
MAIVMASSTKTTLVLAKMMIMMISMSRIHVTQVLDIKIIEVKMIIVEQFGSQFSLQD